MASECEIHDCGKNAPDGWVLCNGHADAESRDHIRQAVGIHTETGASDADVYLALIRHAICLPFRAACTAS